MAETTAIPEDSGANTAVARQFCPPEDLPMAHALQIYVGNLRRAVSICDHRLPWCHGLSDMRVAAFLRRVIPLLVVSGFLGGLTPQRLFVAFSRSVLALVSGRSIDT